MPGTFPELDEEDRKILAQQSKDIRAWLVAVGKARRLAQRIKTANTAKVSDILAQITSTDEPIPDDNGLGGSQTLTKSDITTVNGWVNTFITQNTGGSYDNMRSRAGGVNDQGEPRS